MTNKNQINLTFKRIAMVYAFKFQTFEFRTIEIINKFKNNINCDFVSL